MFKRYVSLPGQIKASLTTLGKYKELRGLTCSEDENPEEEGYTILREDDSVAYIEKKLFDMTFVPAHTPNECMQNELDQFKQQRSMITEFLKSDVSRANSDSDTVKLFHIQNRLMCLQETLMEHRLKQGLNNGNSTASEFTQLDFSSALLFLKAGFRIARKHWIPKEKYLRLILRNEIRINSITDEKQVDQIWYYGPDGHGSYTPQQCDLINEDWIAFLN